MNPIGIDPIWIERGWGFLLGVLSSIVASALIFMFDTGKTIFRVQRFLVQTASSSRLRKIQNKNDPHAVIRNEWAIALRDLGSNKPSDVLRALQSLFYMADLLEPDEREVAREALRLRIAINMIRDTDREYLRAMNSLL